MIRIEKIRIREFRGIRDLELDFGCKNFAIYGPNGSGKSGVVDAIEFALTGNLSRLSGDGTRDLKVRNHAPHVDVAEYPEKAQVELTAFIPSLNRSATSKRCVANLSRYELAPEEETLRAIFDKLEVHPEFALSRRQISQYILFPASARKERVQELLRLWEVERTRKVLHSIHKEARDDCDRKKANYNKERSELLQILGLEASTIEAILNAVNARRKILFLAPLDKLEADTSFKEGVLSTSENVAPPATKARALQILDAINIYDALGEPQETATKRQAALSVINELLADAQSRRSFRQQNFVKMGIELVDGDLCPLCDIAWDRNVLLEYLSGKLESAERANFLLTNLNENLTHVIAARSALSSMLAQLSSVCTELIPTTDGGIVTSYAKELEASTDDLQIFISDAKNIESVKEVLDQKWWIFPAAVQKQISFWSSAVAVLPHASQEDMARDFLTQAEICFSKVVKSKRLLREASDKAELSERASDIYVRQSDTILETLYEEVSGDFAAYYRSLNHDDENAFEAELVPSGAQLEFKVDFYGRGKFPPAAYHSEGHQDGMGLCLYLALMKRTLGDEFTFSVLDDVLISVDANHRREVCKLLTREFPNTQFILTTHDQVWRSFMQTERLISPKGSVTFIGWSPLTGPKVLQHREVWDEIENHIQRGDKVAAAARLRNYLEYISEYLAASLKAKVEFKGDGQYNLSDLMRPVVDRWNNKLKEAIKVEQGWEKTEKVACLTALKSKVSEAYQKIQDEWWQLNATVHFNKFIQLEDREFREVIAAFSDILSTMRCETCQHYVELERHGGASEFIRCYCGGIDINLNRKRS